MKRLLALQARLFPLFGAHVRRAWDLTDGKSAALHGPVAFGAILLWVVIPTDRKPYLLTDQHHPCCVRINFPSS
jgi:hypothetical protein